MNYISFSKDFKNEKYKSFPFYKDSKPLEDAAWGLSLKNAGSMRFRWNESNSVRESFLSSLCNSNHKISQVQLDHTKIVYSVKSESDTLNKIGDGIVTNNTALIPVVTVADCVPLYLYDSFSGTFGVVHSGWKGTGIIENAISIFINEYGSRKKNISVSIGPHIHDCCYIVNRERADYFVQNFGSDCINRIKEGEPLYKNPNLKWNYGEGDLYRLSLLKANLNILAKNGIRDENICIATDCTCCNEIFGSNRRETSEGSSFTVQAAFLIRDSNK